MIQEPKTQETRAVTLKEILPLVRELSVYDKLVLAQILYEECERDPLLPLLQENRVVQFFSPIEVSGDLTHFALMLEEAGQNSK